MLIIDLSETETDKACSIQFEHSLVSLSKWESEVKRPFHSDKEMSTKETLFYVECMRLTPDPPANYMDRLEEGHLIQILEYINESRTATTFSELPGKPRSRAEVTTSELIYYWMIQFQIPFECQNWHLSRLMTLIRIAGIKQTKPKPMSKQALAEQYRALNAKRRSELGTPG